MSLPAYIAATVALAAAAALAVGREDARPSFEGTYPPPAEAARSPLDNLTSLKRDVEAATMSAEELAAVMADGNADGRFADVAEVAEVALGTPASVREAAEAAWEATARAEERRTGTRPSSPPEGRVKFYAGVPVYQASARIWNEAGVAYYSLERAGDAHSCFLSALALDPAYDEPHANLGLLYRRKGWYDKALAEYDAALELRPTNSIVWYNRAVALQRLGRTEDEVSSLEKAAALAPKYRPPLKRLAVIWYDLGDYETAREYAQRLLYLSRADEAATPEEVAEAEELLTLAENRLAGKKAEPALTVEGTAAPPPPGR
jgi:tetratricopeptide (TPR) repeat protein